MKYKAGVDEAGRGPVLGPMVMAIVAVTEEDKKLFNQLGVKDSKKVPPTKRNKLAKYIKKQCPHVIISVSVQKIDQALETEGDSLNLLEARTTTQLINRLLKKTACSEVMLDLPAKNKETYLAAVRKNLAQNISIEAEFKADEHHIAVAAASILAKTTRDAAIRKQEKLLGVQLGSGYPSDPNTQKILEEQFDLLKEQKLLRTSWKTVKEKELSRSQTRLGNF